MMLTAATLVATSALAEVLVDKTKLIEWRGESASELHKKETMERTRQAHESHVRFNNVAKRMAQSKTAQTNPDILPNDVIDDGTRINFSVVNWFMGDFLGLASIRPVANTPLECFAKDITMPENAFYADGHIYFMTYQSGGGQVLSSEYGVYNVETGELEKSIPLEQQWYTVWNKGAYNPANGKMIVLGYDGRRTPYLSELDPETGAYTQFVFCPESIMAMTFDAKGTLYALTSAGEIETIDLTTGLGTSLFRVEEEGTGIYYWQSLAFDYHTGELFWIRSSSNFETDLRRIDLEAKSVEVVTDLNDFGFAAAWVDSPTAPDKAPDTVAGLSVDFGGNGSHVGTIHVTAPSRTFDGSDLNGDIRVSVSVEGREPSVLTLSPGESAALENVDFLKSGEHKVVASVEGEGGKGPDGSIIAYCGPDTPSPVSNVRLEVAKDGTASLAWEAPEGGVHQGYFNPDLLTYDVVRFPDEVKVASGISATSLKDNLPNDLRRYHYAVTVSCDGIPGDAVESNSIVYGDGMTLPFMQQVGDEAFFPLATVYDLDGDGNTWYDTWGSASSYTGWHDEFFQSDDWYITPPIALEPGNYLVETDYAGIGGKSSFEFTFGDSQNPEDHRLLQSFTDLVYEDGRQTYRTYVAVDKADKYYFGYHFNSTTQADPDMPYLSIYTLRVDNGPVNEAPAAVTVTEILPAELGKLESFITFTTPVVAFDGSPLNSIDRVEICNSADEVIGTVSAVEPGKSYTFTDSKATEGYNTYHIYACNDAGRGTIAETEVYVGNDLPDLVSYLNYKVEDNRVVTFEWGLPSTLGLRGGYVDPNGLTYNFCRSEYDWQEPFPMDETRNLKERTFTWTECQPDGTFGTAQHMYMYGIQAVSEVGEGRLGYTGIILGDPCQAPFVESFSGGYLSTSVWANQLVEGVSGWSVTTSDPESGIEPSDGDYGMMLFSPEGNSFHAAVLPLIELRDMRRPVLVFDMYHSSDTSSDGVLSLQISSSDAAYKPLAQIGSKAEASGWSEHKISLADYNGDNRLFIAFVGVGSGKNSAFAVDNIRVCDDIDCDIALESLSAPESMDLGETAAFRVRAFGKGLKTAEDFDIDIYADGLKVATVTGSQLAPAASVELTVEVTTDAANAGKEVVYEARVNHAADGNDSNDSVFATVHVGGSSLPAPENLTGIPSSSTIDLTWDVPAPAGSTFKEESFEDWTSFAITGEKGWKFVDRDQLHPYGIADVEYPNMDKPRAWMVWTPGEIRTFPGRKDWMPSTGDKCLIAFASSYLRVDGDFDFSQQSDEWLISPHVAGGTELKFKAGIPMDGNTERFEVLISYGGRNPEDFTAIGEPEALSEAGWKEFTYTLPADAAYFAIHFISQGWESFAMMIDDIKFAEGYDEAELIGYNIYLNGERMNSDPIAETRASVAYDASSEAVYGVSAVYYEGESEMAVLSAASEVAGVSVKDVRITASKSRIIVEAPAGLTFDIFTPAGVRIDSRLTSGYDEVLLSEGIYFVNIAGSSVKVIVR